MTRRLLNQGVALLVDIAIAAMSLLILAAVITGTGLDALAWAIAVTAVLLVVVRLAQRHDRHAAHQEPFDPDGAADCPCYRGPQSEPRPRT